LNEFKDNSNVSEKESQETGALELSPEEKMQFVPRFRSSCSGVTWYYGNHPPEAKARCINGKATRAKHLVVKHQWEIEQNLIQFKCEQDFKTSS